MRYGLKESNVKKKKSSQKTGIIASIKPVNAVQLLYYSGMCS